jgi:ATP-dependent DNA helicase RecG
MVGTHALIEENVIFHRLGLAIVDEQHRFGVRQRLALKDKGRFAHQLAMSATPIPRTLAMSYYADLDVSILDELPPGRTPVSTRLVSAARRDEIVARVRDACQSGGQAYWVCPLIEESETLQLQTAEDTYAQLLNDLPTLRVGLVHGRMKGEEKAAVMAAFAANQIHVLVATTVIEVGVDVPNASLMVIEHAERFGLSQLHQLRGRVGRGAVQSTCILLYAQPLGQIARARLKVIFENNDGFAIAREDLRLRGPGEFIGERQSGLPLLRYADLEDAVLVEQARQIADILLAEAPAVAQAHLHRWLGGREALLKA